MATTTRLTLDEFLKLPETEPASEYVCGEVFQKAMPTIVHGVIQMLLSIVVGQFVLSNRLGIAGSEIRCIFGPEGQGRAYVPDWMFIAAHRMPSDDASANGPYYGAPDLAVEILSPDDRPRRVLSKVLFYLNHGVRLVWLIDPEDRVVTVYTPEDRDGRTLATGDTLDGDDVLPGFRAPVDEVFPKRPAA
jgi:Uma2 family endonuclease